MKLRTIYLLAALAALASCNDNELDINAPWKETPVVYAVINAGQDSQIFRIQKTYQNSINQSTADVAQIADSLVMKNISVELRDLVTGASMPLKRLAPRKQPGFFSNKDSSYWGENLRSFINPLHAYELLIKSANTGNTYRGVTSVVDTCNIQALSTPIDLSNTSQPAITFRILSGGRNASFYDLVVRFHYTEAPAGNPGDTVRKQLDYFFTLNKLRPGNVTSSLDPSNNAIAKSGILDFLRRNIQADPSVTRTFVSLEYVFIGSNQAYNDMIQVNSPSTSVIAKGSDFSNISDGIGVFASRSETRKEQPVSSSTVTLLNSIFNPR